MSTDDATTTAMAALARQFIDSALRPSRLDTAKHGLSMLRATADAQSSLRDQEQRAKDRHRISFEMPRLQASRAAQAFQEKSQAMKREWLQARSGRKTADADAARQAWLEFVALKRPVARGRSPSDCVISASALLR